MEKSFHALIEESKSILILLSKDPYFDQVAAGVSLYLALKNHKDVTIACPSPMLVEFNKIVGVNKVTPDIGNKNLVVKLKNYNPDNVERVTYDIDPTGEMQLVVIPKVPERPPTKEQVLVTYAGVSADTIILIGGINDSHFPVLSSKDLLEAKIIHIGTKDFHGPQGREILSFAEGASSVSEIVAKIIKENGVTLDQDLASNLLMGIHEGSKGFTRSEVTAATFKLAAELVEAGGRNVQTFSPAPQFQFSPRPAIDTNPLERPQGETVTPPAPKSWTQPPKIFKGTSIS